MGRKLPTLFRPAAAGNTNDRGQRGPWVAPLLAFKSAAARVVLPVDRGETDPALAALCDAIVKDVQMQAGMARAGIMGDYAARMRYARKHMKPAALQAALRALKMERDAALAALARRTSLELRGRLAAAKRQARNSRGPQPT